MNFNYIDALLLLIILLNGVLGWYRGFILGLIDLVRWIGSFLAALYPAVSGGTQMVTGGLSDRTGRKWMIALGMVVQAAGIVLFVAGKSFALWGFAAVLLGLGTAMVYPTLLAAVGDVAHPSWRASAVGVYRLCRDGGYAVGALLAGSLADALGVRWAIGAIGGLTFLSGVIVASVMSETHQRVGATQ